MKKKTWEGNNVREVNYCRDITASSGKDIIGISECGYFKYTIIQLKPFEPSIFHGGNYEYQKDI
ncbi:MAG: hypothetical protein GY765_01840 [bacterium]|nr:hypothetical protein [bacterium]